MRITRDSLEGCIQLDDTLLSGLDTTRSSTGGGTLWDIAQATSGESPDFIATE